MNYLFIKNNEYPYSYHYLPYKKNTYYTKENIQYHHPLIYIINQNESNKNENKNEWEASCNTLIKNKKVIFSP